MQLQQLAAAFIVFKSKTKVSQVNKYQLACL